tara:strand:+ start:417 stop:812 length:396 start_codon:yes stop_codon:yes gene_type:complete
MIKCGITGSSGTLGKRIKKNLPYKFYEFKKDSTKINEVKNWIDNNNFDILLHLAAKVPARRVDKDYKKFHNVGAGNQFNLKTIASLISKTYKKEILFTDSKKPTYLISNNKKILKLGWKPKKNDTNLKYFY